MLASTQRAFLREFIFYCLKAQHLYEVIRRPLKDNVNLHGERFLADRCNTSDKDTTLPTTPYTSETG